MTTERRSPSAPLRTCVGCRERAAQSTLLRVVVVEDVLVPDVDRLLPGRGAYLHPDPACLALAERRRAFSRALRLTGAVPTDRLAAHLEPGKPSSTSQEAGRVPR